jgi:hypothetical protein
MSDTFLPVGFCCDAFVFKLSMLEAAVCKSGGIFLVAASVNQLEYEVFCYFNQVLFFGILPPVPV